jgi:hypothetical protein
MRPVKGAKAAPKMAPTLVAPEISVRLQPNSSVIGMTKKVKTVMEEAAFPNSAAPAAIATNHP